MFVRLLRTHCLTLIALLRAALLAWTRTTSALRTPNVLSIPWALDRTGPDRGRLAR